MNYFGVESDHLAWLSDEMDATAIHFGGDAHAALKYLAVELARLAPLFEEVSQFCGADEPSEETESTGGIVYAFQHAKARQK